MALKFKLKTLKKVFSVFGANLACKVDNSEKTRTIAIIRPTDLSKGSLANIRNPDPPFNLEAV